jgi:hypothetical protein
MWSSQWRTPGVLCDVRTEVEKTIRDINIQPSTNQAQETEYLATYENCTPNTISPTLREKKEDRQCTYDVTMRRVRVTFVAVEKQYVLHILGVQCVFEASVIQHAMRMRNIIICCLAGCTVFFHFIS